MELNNNNKRKLPPGNIIARIIICILIIGIGGVGMTRLAGHKKPPAEAEKKERPLRVEVLQVKSEDAKVTITGFGEVKVLKEVALSPEVSGRIVYLHPRMKAGESVRSGEVLFRIDQSNYTAALQEARAQVRQWENTIARLKKQYELDKDRLKTVERNKALAREEYDRIRRLFEIDKVGTRSGVDKAEQAYNAAVDAADQLSRAVSLYPLQIKEAESSRASAQARLTLAMANLERCEIRAPFDGRIKQASVEKDQYLMPGTSVVTLADDSVLEIHVALDSRDARNWLEIENNGPDTSNPAWFGGLAPVNCNIRWTEAPRDHVWSGRLHRAVRFNPQTRTLTVAIRIDAEAMLSRNGDALPLVEGMFCSVEIPGRTMSRVYRLPRWAVTFNSTVYIAHGDRLKTVPVRIVRSEEDFTYVSEGIEDGDRVITTRLVDPMENALLEIVVPTDTGASS